MIVVGVRDIEIVVDHHAVGDAAAGGACDPPVRHVAAGALNSCCTAIAQVAACLSIELAVG